MTPPTRALSDVGARATLLMRRYAFAVAGLMYGLTIGMKRGANRALVAQIARHFGYTGLPPAVLESIEIDALTSPATPIILPVVVAEPGNVSELELITLARLVVERQPRAILEIGTFDGRTTAALAANSPPMSEVTTLDLPADGTSLLPVESRDLGLIDKAQSGERFIGAAFATRIRQVYGDSATFDFGGLEVDLAFIDGSHSYEYALSDSRRVRAMLRGGKGLIVWHDYGVEWTGVTRALNELSAEGPFRGIRAVTGTTLAVLDLR